MKITISILRLEGSEGSWLHCDATWFGEWLGEVFATDIDKLCTALPAGDEIGGFSLVSGWSPIVPWFPFRHLHTIDIRIPPAVGSLFP